MTSARSGRHQAVSSALAALTDEQLAELVDSGSTVHSGIGGASVRTVVGGVPVFVKQIPLTDVERRHVGSTANLHDLPPHYHYGIGSAGFGAWRELAALRLVSDRALADPTFPAPLLFHWRVLQQPPPARTDDADVETMVRRWSGSPAVRERLLALDAARARLVLCCEFLPQRLDNRLADRNRAGTVDAALDTVAGQLLDGIAALRDAGLVHFDAHFANIVTDGDHLYFADYGLACSPSFDLSPDESEFLTVNASHDRAYVVMQLVNWVVAAVVGIPERAERVAWIERCAAGGRPDGLSPPVTALVVRHAPVAAELNRFYDRLASGRTDTPFPAAALDALWRADVRR